jgi:hypothetical protein
LQPHVFLALDDSRDLAIFDRLELVGGDLALLASGAGLFQRRSAEQTADMIGAEGGCLTLAHHNPARPRESGDPERTGFPLSRE